jgi:isopenicillin N synthase-like dioxygenase
MAAAVHSAPEVPLLSLIKSTPKDVLDALSTIGFIHLDLDGTGLTQEDVDRAFQLSKLIHNVPLEDRVDLKLDPRGNGYMPMKGSLDERSSSVDFKEAYVWGRFKSSAGETQTIQKLPKVVADLRHEIEEFDNKCFEASLRVLDMLSQALSVRLNMFIKSYPRR